MGPRPSRGGLHAVSVASWHEEIAWAAGFFEGEGSVTLHGKRLAVSIKNNDLDPLVRFRRIVQSGKVYGPYQYASRLGRNPFWFWVAQQDAALAVLQDLAPWLTRRRLAQALDALAKLPVPPGSPTDLAYTSLWQLRRRGDET